MTRYQVLEVIEITEPKTFQLRCGRGQAVVVVEKDTDGEFPIDLAKAAQNGAEIMDYRDAVEATREEGVA